MRNPAGTHVLVDHGLLRTGDSTDPRGSFRDRHEKLGQGPIGAAAFAGVPFIAGTPGRR